MDLVKKQSQRAHGNVIALVWLCGNVFALRRVRGQLLVVRVR